MGPDPEYPLGESNRKFGGTEEGMAYYARVFCTAATAPTIRTVLAWLRDEAGYAAEVPGRALE